MAIKVNSSVFLEGSLILIFLYLNLRAYVRLAANFTKLIGHSAETASRQPFGQLTTVSRDTEVESVASRGHHLTDNVRLGIL